MGILQGWDWRGSLEIIGSVDGTKNNHPVFVKVLFDSTKMKTDFGDIRFTADDGTTLLEYSILNKVDSSYAIFIVNIPTIPANPDTVDIYVYAGNSDAVTTANIADVGVLGDDFNDNSLDTNKWATVIPGGASTTITETSGQLRIYIATAYDCLGWWENTYDVPYVLTDYPSTDFMVIVKNAGSYVYNTTQHGIGLFEDSGDALFFGRIRDDGSSVNGLRVSKLVNNVGSVLADVAFTTSTYWLRIRKQEDTFYFDYSTDTETWTNLYNTSSLGITPANIILYTKKLGTAGGTTGRYDDFVILNNTANPPTVGSLGAWESTSFTASNSLKTLFEIIRPYSDLKTDFIVRQFGKADLLTRACIKRPYEYLSTTFKIKIFANALLKTLFTVKRDIRAHLTNDIKTIFTVNLKSNAEDLKTLVYINGIYFEDLKLYGTILKSEKEYRGNKKIRRNPQIKIIIEDNIYV